ncbi:MAG: hypothetical protein ACPG4W_05175 [Flavobacteriales bacterium]
MIITVLIHASLLLMFRSCTIDNAPKEVEEFGAIALNFSEFPTANNKPISTPNKASDLAPKPLEQQENKTKEDAVTSAEDILAQKQAAIALQKEKERKEKERKEKEKAEKDRQEIERLTQGILDQGKAVTGEKNVLKTPELADFDPVSNQSKDDQANFDAYMNSISASNAVRSGYFLNGRTSSKIVKPNYTSDKEGFVVAKIEVDENGNTTVLGVGIQHSTISDPKLMNEIKKALKETKWSPFAGRKSQVGYIIYSFKIN